MLSSLTFITYWLLIFMWAGILAFCVKRLRRRKLDSALFGTIVLIFTIDAVRTLFESLYFGGWYTARVGLLPMEVYDFLMRPGMVFIPKAVNLAAAVWMILLLKRRWLPQEAAEQLRVERQLDELQRQVEEKEQAALELRQSEERLRNIMESSPMGLHLYALNDAGELSLAGANPAADRILGIDHAPLLGKPIVEAFPALAGSDIPDRYKRICATGVPWTAEDLRYEDGSVNGAFEVHAFQTLPGRMAAHFLDVTERKQAQERLSMTQFTVDNAAVPVFWIRPDGSFSYVNDAACRLFAYSRQELAALGLGDITAQASLREVIWETIKQEQHAVFDVLGKKKDGSLFPMEVTSHFIRFGQQEFEFAFVLDQTKRKDAENALADLNANLEKTVHERTQELIRKADQLEEANIRLTEMDRLKSSLLTSVSHELKTPLTSIIGYATLSGKELSKKVAPKTVEDGALAASVGRLQENVSIIGMESSRLLGLINNFLALAKLNSGHASKTGRSVNMVETLQRAAGLSRPHFAVHPALKFETHIDDDLPSVAADADNMVQAVLNLLDNAVKFTDAGTVRLSAAKNDAGDLRIEVADPGPGVPETERERIFDAFHQVCTDDHCHHKPAGTGMGLAICKQIVESYGGAVRLECPEDGGSVFIVEMPAYRPTPEESLLP